MGLTSGQITARLKQSQTPLQDKQKIYESTRYFVAQKPAVHNYEGTKPGFFRGRVVIPGPKANPELSIVLSEKDVRLAEAKFFIRFVDNKVTPDADDELRQALFTIMDNHEADEYEAELKKLKK